MTVGMKIAAAKQTANTKACQGELEMLERAENS